VAAAIANILAGRQPHLWRLYLAATCLLAFLALVLFTIACLVVNGLISEGLMGMTPDSTNLNDVLHQTQIFLILPWGMLFFGMGTVALSLPLSPSSLRPKRLVVAPVVAASLGALLIVGAAALILNTSVRPIQADIVFKMGQGQQRMGSQEIAADLYEQAIELAPRQDFYYIFLGQVQLEQAKQEQEPARQADWLTQAQKTFERAQVLNPLNPDHAANLARFYWQATALETDSAAKETNPQIADVYYERATGLAPHQPLLWNEWARLRQSLGDEAQACRLLEHSLALDSAFEQTKQFYAQTCPEALPTHPHNLGFEQDAP
jgi:hypothetical protein